MHLEDYLVSTRFCVWEWNLRHLSAKKLHALSASAVPMWVWIWTLGKGCESRRKPWRLFISEGQSSDLPCKRSLGQLHNLKASARPILQPPTDRELPIPFQENPFCLSNSESVCVTCTWELWYGNKEVKRIQVNSNGREGRMKRTQMCLETSPSLLCCNGQECYGRVVPYFALHTDTGTPGTHLTEKL